MPYRLSKDGLSVLKSDKVVKKHNSRKQALKHLAALRLNVKEAGARHSGNDSKMLQEIHDHAVNLGATCNQSESVADILKRHPRQMEAIAKWLQK